ncbi:hypothetical protein GGI35DRAFT_262950 [Trichoderma velutinum]
MPCDASKHWAPPQGMASRQMLRSSAVAAWYALAVGRCWVGGCEYRRVAALGQHGEALPGSYIEIRRCSFDVTLTYNAGRCLFDKASNVRCAVKPSIIVALIAYNTQESRIISPLHALSIMQHQRTSSPTALTSSSQDFKHSISTIPHLAV